MVFPEKRPPSKSSKAKAKAKADNNADMDNDANQIDVEKSTKKKGRPAKNDTAPTAKKGKPAGKVNEGRKSRKSGVGSESDEALVGNLAGVVLSILEEGSLKIDESLEDYAYVLKMRLFQDKEKLCERLKKGYATLLETLPSLDT